MRERVDSLEDIAERPSKRRSQGADRHEFGFMRRRTGENTANFIGSGSGIHFVQSVYNAANSRSKTFDIPTTSPESDLVPGEEDHLAATPGATKNASVWRHGEVSSSSSAEGPVTFENLISWSESYWDYWHPCFPYLHAPTVLDWFEELARPDHRHASDPVWDNKLVVVKSIISISLADRRQLDRVSGSSGVVPVALVFETTEAAIKSVQSKLSSPPSMLTLQATVSVQLFLVSMLHHNGASRIGGLLVRMLQQMGLHRCPARYATFTPEEGVLRKRMFWTIYTIDRHISQSLGLPLGVRDDDFDVCFFDQERHLAPASTEHGMDHRLAVCHFLSRLSELKGTILELCNKSINHRQAGAEQATLITTEIARLGNDMEDFVSIAPSTEPSIRAAHLATIEVIRQECIIALNRPLLTASKASAEYKMGLQLCISAARSIISVLAKHSSSGNVTAADHLPQLLWPSFTWAIWMSAFIVVFAAMEGEMNIDAARMLAEQCSDLLTHLSLRGTAWPNACAAAIRDLSGHIGRQRRPPALNTGGTSTLDHEALELTSHATAAEGTSVSSASSAAPVRGSQPAEPERGQELSNITSTSSSEDIWKFLNIHPNTAEPTANVFTDPTYDYTNPFDGFDIPFWIGDDQFNTTWMDNRNDTI